MQFNGPRRSRLGEWAGLLAATLAICAPSPASAANQQVQVQDNFFNPGAVAVKPGESVTWNHAAGGEQHGVQIEPTDVVKEPDLAAWQASRTFNTPGTYRYFCQVHGSFGGQGMSGIVYVNAAGTIPFLPPVASFTVSPSVVQPNQVVTFDAAGSSDPDGPPGSIAKYEWDLDGIIGYEITGSMATVQQPYSTVGVRTVRLKITDSQGLENETTRQVTVTEAPTASFTFSPNPARTGQAVTFNGSASSDSDGIATYTWDLDGDGAFETDGGSSPTISRTYTTPGTRNVRLRVTDTLGARSQPTSRSLQVNAPPPPPPPGPTPIAPAIKVPSNVFSFTGKVIVRRRLTILTLSVPGPGVLKAAQTGSARKALVKPVTARPGKAGKVTLKFRPSKAGKKRLRSKKSFSVRLKVTYTPTGGRPRSTTKRIKIKR